MRPSNAHVDVTSLTLEQKAQLVCRVTVRGALR